MRNTVRMVLWTTSRHCSWSSQAMPAARRRRQPQFWCPSHLQPAVTSDRCQSTTLLRRPGRLAWCASNRVQRVSGGPPQSGLVSLMPRPKVPACLDYTFTWPAKPRKPYAYLLPGKPIPEIQPAERVAGDGRPGRTADTMQAKIGHRRQVTICVA